MNLTDRLSDQNPPRLCYIAHGYAYFTTLQDVTRQWGDDWNDIPYEHNAEEPYPWNDRRGVPRYEISKFPFECSHLLTPPDFLNYTNNSPYSVEMINRGDVPWLQTPSYDYYSGPVICIMAGTSFNDFVTMVHLAGGEVYVPIQKNTNQ